MPPAPRSAVERRAAGWALLFSRCLSLHFPFAFSESTGNKPLSHTGRSWWGGFYPKAILRLKLQKTLINRFMVKIFRRTLNFPSKPRPMMRNGNQDTGHCPLLLSCFCCFFACHLRLLTCFCYFLPVHQRVAGAAAACMVSRVCSRFSHARAGSSFKCGARNEERNLLAANKRRKTPPRAETDPALRVAWQMAPCRVAELGKVNHLACVPRLAWNHLPRNAGATETGTDPRTPRWTKSAIKYGIQPSSDVLS